MKWIEPSGFKGDTSGGKSLEEARGKATLIDQRLERAANPFAVATLLQLIADYVASGRSPYSGESWKEGYEKQTEGQLVRSVRAYEDRCAMDVDRILLDLMRAQAGTDRMVRQNTTAPRGLLNWGYRHPAKYFTPVSRQSCSPGAVSTPSRPWRRVRRCRSARSAPARSVSTTTTSRTATPLTRSGSVGWPSSSASSFPPGGLLAVEMAGNLGCRWGEQFQLTVDDVHLYGCDQIGMGSAGRDGLWGREFMNPCIHET